MTDEKPRVVAVIPCYNTAPHIAEVVTKSLQHVDQVIVVDDGSTDDTAEKAGAAGAKVISHGSNQGNGEAIKSCFKAVRAASADILITIDGDGQHDANEIPIMLKSFQHNNTDLVIGSRFVGTSSTMPIYRRFGNTIINWLFNFGSTSKCSDTQSGFRAYSKKVINALNLKESGMSISVESLIKARQGGFHIQEVPITCIYHSDSSTINPVWHGICVVFAVLKYRLLKRWIIK